MKININKIFILLNIIDLLHCEKIIK